MKGALAVHTGAVGRLQGAGGRGCGAAGARWREQWFVEGSRAWLVEGVVRREWGLCWWFGRDSGSGGGDGDEDV